ncbi:ribosome biogenesis GTPase Der [Lujinxingia vulgaris]|uniref:GTPase Der n=1 Tax=Lujinxingia vulgaris TaxID=2600176 RepID=A0A5C6X458_9DELT|nr:ribosome biogenesis GTPase Der [Lujinxingia vulgaris]TXD33059.1 ribosome biogenesis GTPase Der [Lujinxingia vulgaris]
MAFMIAIVGRPNVGKSRLFNRLIESQTAIVHDFEGVTRDRQYGDGEWFGRPFTVVDTGGFVPRSEDPMLQQMRHQAQLAVDEADAIIFVVDGRAGLAGADQEIFELLRTTDKPVFLAVNKIDTWTGQEQFLADFYQLGVPLYSLSAEHGIGLDPLMDDVMEDAPKGEVLKDEPFARIAVVGKPNAGKSSTINALLGENRLLTSDVAGTTRDSIDTMVRVDGKEYLVIDTAGLRRKRSISQRLEEFSVVQAIRSIDRADVALLVLDATQPISTQDKKIASVVQNRGRGCVILVNKWDLVEKDTNTAGEYVKSLRQELQFVDYAPVIFVSALTGQRVHKILGAVDTVFEQYTRRVQTSELNRFLEGAVARHSPPMHGNRRAKFFYISQVATRPPTFMFSVNYVEAVAPSYRKYLENQLREAYTFEGVPLRTVLRPRQQRDRD